MAIYNVSLDACQYMSSCIDGPLWYAHKITPGSEIELDFSKITFLRPEVVILMIAVSKMIYEKNNRPVLWKGLPRESALYLQRIGINKIDFVQVERIEKSIFEYFVINNNQRTYTNLIPLEIVQTPPQLENILKLLRDKLGEWFPGRPNNFSNDVCSIVSEIAGNSLEHSVLPGSSELPTCYLTVQSYRPSNKIEPNAIIALGDIGIGIGGSLRSAQKRYGDSNAIQKALFGGVSRRENSGGLGFMEVSRVLKNNGGRITIRSGTGSVQYMPSRNNKEIKTHKFCLIGTQTAFFL